MSYKDIINKYKDLYDNISNIENLDNTTILKILLDFDKRITDITKEKAGVNDIVNVEFTPTENGLTYADGVADFLGVLKLTLKDNIVLNKDCAVKLNIKGSESIIVDVDENDNGLEIHIDSDIISKINRSLLTPLTPPTKTKLVAVDETNSQEMLSLDENDFEIDNNNIKIVDKFALKDNLGFYGTLDLGTTQTTGTTEWNYYKILFDSLNTNNNNLFVLENNSLKYIGTKTVFAQITQTLLCSLKGSYHYGCVIKHNESIDLANCKRNTNAQAWEDTLTTTLIFPLNPNDVISGYFIGSGQAVELLAYNCKINIEILGEA